MNKLQMAIDVLREALDTDDGERALADRVNWALFLLESHVMQEFITDGINERDKQFRRNLIKMLLTADQ